MPFWVISIWEEIEFESRKNRLFYIHIYKSRWYHHRAPRSGADGFPQDAIFRLIESSPPACIVIYSILYGSDDALYLSLSPISVAKVKKRCARGLQITPAPPPPKSCNGKSSRRVWKTQQEQLWPACRDFIYVRESYIFTRRLYPRTNIKVQRNSHYNNFFCLKITILIFLLVSLSSRDLLPRNFTAHVKMMRDDSEGGGGGIYKYITRGE